MSLYMDLLNLCTSRFLKNYGEFLMLLIMN